VLPSTPVISLRGIRQNNLRGFDLALPLGQLIVITGVSGSGKSSLAFDTLYAEGQRRYVECLSSYTRQFIERMDRPRVDEIKGILPSVALRQGRSIRAARATVATLTELGEHFRMLFAHGATPQCPKCGAAVQRTSLTALVDALLAQAAGRKAAVTFELPVLSTLSAQTALLGLGAAGYTRAFEQGRAQPLAGLLNDDRVGIPVHVLQDRLVIDVAERSRLFDSLEQAMRRGSGAVSVWVDGEALTMHAFARVGDAADFQQFRATGSLRCAVCATEIEPPSPHLFSFNSAVGACPACNGFGRIADLDLDRVVPDGRKTLKQGAIKPWSTESTTDERRDLARFCERLAIAMDVPWNALPGEQRDAIVAGEKGSARSGKFYGIRGWFKWQESRTYKMHVRVLLARYRAYTPCPMCEGTRLRAEARAWKLHGWSLPEWLAAPLGDVQQHLETLELAEMAQAALEQPLREVRHRLAFLHEVGLHYLSLDRAARTLSGGELQRVQLVAALATGMSQVLYVLDEPSVGLHPRDNDRLLRILERMRAAGNTVVVVEHDPALMLAADTIVDLGPGAGSEGGALQYFGPASGLADAQNCLTADYLTGRRQVDVLDDEPTLRQSKRKAAIRQQKWLTIRQPTARNLRGEDVRLLQGALNAVCGVSGSGKSTLIEEVLYRQLLRQRGESVDEPGACAGIECEVPIGEVILVDQELPAAASRANCATYLKVWDAIRSRLAEEPLAAQRGYTPATFSFNREGGRCAVCEGLGFEVVDMQFLSDVRMTCEACEGQRFRQDVLQVRHRGKSAADFLNMTAAEVAQEFSFDSTLANPMRALTELGLGYLRLGQPLSTLSGGESQRVKIAWHLLQARTKNALFLLDEPSTGLHLHDVAILLKNLRALTAAGNTVVLVEHHLDLIAAADYVVELGPDGGPAGGHVLYQGDAAGLAERDTPTAEHLRRHKLGVSYQRAAGLGVDSQALDVERDPGHVAVRGARVHNLRNLSLDIPRDRFTVVTGLSGSGKSSLAFDVVFAEGQRRFLDCLSPYARQYLPPASRPDVESLAGLPPTVAIAQRTTRGGTRSTVATLTDIYPYLRLLYARCGAQLCPKCAGPVSGQTAADVADAITERFGQAAVYVMAPAVRGRKGHHQGIIDRAIGLNHAWLHVDGALVPIQAVPPLRRFAVHDIDLVVARITADVPNRAARIAEAVDVALGLGDGTVMARTSETVAVPWSLRRHCGRCDISVEAPDPRLFTFTSAAGWCKTCLGTGVEPAVARVKLKKTKKRKEDGRSTADLAKAGLPDGGQKLDDEAVRLVVACHACQGSRLRPEARSVLVAGQTIDVAVRQGPAKLQVWLEAVKWSRRDAQVAQPIVAEVAARCAFLQKVGLDYLALGRAATTLSGGESQRIRLAAQLSSNLRGVLYVLDEPTIGLHPADNSKVLDALDGLVARGNGLLVVEHDEETIRRADHIIELGPGGGNTGGQLVFEGSLKQLLKAKDSPTGQALRDPHTRRVRSEPRPQPSPFVTVRGARHNNLHNLTAHFARGRFNVVTGVSGSGKSTLVRDLLVPVGNALIAGDDFVADLDGIDGLTGFGRIVEVDQSPIGRTPRSCPATYMAIFDDLRALFANLPDAKVRGLTANKFSFNTAGGRCETCLGAGQVRVEMSFLPSVFVPCETCQGRRYQEPVLAVRHKGATMADVLAMSMAEAANHFNAVRAIAAPLEMAVQLGLGYLTLGQGSHTLSGGEAQRLKLITELAKRRRTETLYVLDEPSTGLHLEDVRKLLGVLHALVDRGDTLVVIEHQLDIVKEADWLVDLGPGAGEAGGQLTWMGGVAELVKSKLKTPTAQALRQS
jgi:excinuclease ABC subunit A